MDNKRIYKYKVLMLSIVLAPVTSVFAMQPLDDQSLSAATGQDGFNIGVSIDQVKFEQAALIDKDGLSNKILDKDYKSPASTVIAGTTNSPVNVKFVGANTRPTINVIVDTDGGNGKAFANIGVSFGSQISGIKISPFAMYLASMNSTSSSTSQSKSIYNGGALNTGVSKIIEIGNANNNFEISFNNTNRPQMNIQLGNVPQGQMIQFSGAIQSICGTGSGCPIAIISGDSSAKFDLQMKATDVTNGFRLNNFYAGIEPTGVVIGNKGTSGKMNIGLNNVMLGREGAIGANTFNGLANGSMGSFGAIGASVKDLKINVSSF